MMCRGLFLLYAILCTWRIPTTVAQSKCRCKKCIEEGNEDIVLHTANVIYNKPGKMSRRAASDPLPCSAVNGMTQHQLSGQLSAAPTCIYTSRPDNDRPYFTWLQYDLQDVFTVDTVTIFRRQELNNDRVVEEMQALEIAVDGDICFSYPKYDDLFDMDNVREKVHVIACDSPLTGRYVRFYKRHIWAPKSHMYALTLCEIQIWVCDRGYYGTPAAVCAPCPASSTCKYDICDNYYGCNQAPLRNVGIKKPAVQSSVLKGNPNNAVDGILLAELADECTSTDPAVDGAVSSWWRVNLLSMFRIFSVKITNRVDCCGDQLDTFTVFVHRMESSLNLSADNICRSSVGRFGTAETGTFTCSQMLTGQYVSIVAPSPLRLQFCEIRPYGYPVRELQPGDSCVQLNMAVYCAPGSTCEDGVCLLHNGSLCDFRNSPQCPTVTECSESQCKYIAGHACAKDEDCVATAICDPLFWQCRLLAGQKCDAASSDLCASGSSCSAVGLCVCAADGATKQLGQKCVPAEGKVGGFCSATQACHHPLAVCVSDTKGSSNGTCQCPSNLQVEHTNYTCGVGPGIHCDNASFICITGLICDFSGICRVQVGQYCGGESMAWCQAGTSCEDGVCKVKLGQDCSGLKQAPCTSGTVCDILSTCNFPPNASCSQHEVCVAGAQCVNGTCQCSPDISRPSDLICKPIRGVTVKGECVDGTCSDPHAHCDPLNTCQCNDGFRLEPFDMACKIDIKHDCSGDEPGCIARSTCDEVDKTCRLKLGQYCGNGNEEYCVRDTVCDAQKECKLDLGGHCEGVDSGHCRLDTFCDLSSRCKYGHGRHCNNTEQCVFGAVCVNWVCQCVEHLAEPNGYTCMPTAGSLGGYCDSTVQCSSPQFTCISQTCYCKQDESGLDKGFSCPPFMGLIVTMTLLSGSAVIGGIYYNIRRQYQQNKEEEEEGDDMDRLAVPITSYQLVDDVFYDRDSWSLTSSSVDPSEHIC